MPLEHLMQATISTEPETLSSNPLSADELRKINAYWRAANYLSVGQIYLFANPLLTEPLRLEHIKPRLLGHWGTTPASTSSTPTAIASSANTIST
jgi:xylulose-5-phosphate/fructose-6-phosphate phosphoketolase